MLASPTDPLIRRIALSVLLAAVLGFTGARAEQRGGWSQLAVMPSERSEIAAAQTGGTVYVIGGITWRGSTNAFEALDLTTGRWRSLPTLTQTLNHAAAAAFDGQIYVTGGFRSIAMTPNVRETWRYTPSQQRWTRRAPMPAPRGAHAMVAVNGRLYVVGGVGERSQELWSYDPAADAWNTHHAPLPTPRVFSTSEPSR